MAADIMLSPEGDRRAPVKLEDLCRPQRQRHIHTRLIPQAQTDERNKRKDKAERIISVRGEDGMLNKRLRE